LGEKSFDLSIKTLPISPIGFFLTQEKFAYWSKNPGYAAIRH